MRDVCARVHMRVHVCMHACLRACARAKEDGFRRGNTEQLRDCRTDGSFNSYTEGEPSRIKKMNMCRVTYMTTLITFFL